MANPNPSHKFKPGNTYGTGRPKREIEQNYLEILKSELTPAIWAGIVKRAMADALKGVPSARQWLSDYAIGKPSTIVELRGEDAMLLKELLKRFEAKDKTPSEVFLAILQGMQEAEADGHG